MQAKHIDQFLSRDLYDVSSHEYTDYKDMERFVYGLLYANDNFLKVHDNSTQIVKDTYSNNITEKYWAAHDSIVFINIASPFINVSEKKFVLLEGNIQDVTCLLELCMSLSLEKNIRYLRQHYLRMTPFELERRKIEIAECFDDSIYNLPELDIRKDYIIRRLGIKQQFENLLTIVEPKINLMDRMFSRWNLSISLTIASITLLITLLSILK